MNVELFPFQRKALADLRLKTAEAMGGYHRTHAPQVVSFTAPTGAGKTIIMSALIEDILFGDDRYLEQPGAIIVWLSDSPQLNEQSRRKMELRADKIQFSQYVTVSEEAFDAETFQDGHIYFLNTQKLSVTSKLTRNGDDRTYTIWETLANTVREKSDRLYFIIDEAHRGMQGREAGKATTIMQKFLKGSEPDHIPPMPVVIGMSATMQRFNALVEGICSTTYRSVVTPDEVRASGLLKERIVLTCPEEGAVSNDMGILQAAADDWKEKWEHWKQYCTEQHYAHVNPILIVQVLNGTGDRVTDTSLDDCLATIEKRTGFKLHAGQVIHTFGGTTASLMVNGIEVRYEEPSRIADDRNIRIVFFKENLSTGWDCPRAETMMSFKHASDATYIAQLLGRMVRTPMQMRIQVDDVLNDVHLYLPYFNAETVKDIADALQSPECGNIPTDVFGETLSDRKFDILTVRPGRNGEERRAEAEQPPPDAAAGSRTQPDASATPIGEPAPISSPAPGFSPTPISSPSPVSSPVPISSSAPGSVATPGVPAAPERPGEAELFDREAVMKFINDAGLLTCQVRSLRINNYLKSLCKMAHLLTMSGLHTGAAKEVQCEIVKIIHDYVEKLRTEGRYDALVQQVRQFKLVTRIFDAFGESVKQDSARELFTAADADIERQFEIAEAKLGKEGIGKAYGNQYGDLDNPAVFMIEVILFTGDEESMNCLQDYAEKRYHGWIDEYRRRIAADRREQTNRDYDSISSDGDVVSKHNFRLPETIKIPHESGGKAYRNHLFVSDATGVATIRLNTWEAGVIEEEEKRDDFVCWIRNPPRAAWALCIPYEMEGEMKSAYPDFIVVRKDPELGYVIDVLEPHDPNNKDNLGKAKGFAEYARQNPCVGRIQLIRQSRDAAGNSRFLRLDMSKMAVRDKVSQATNTDELDHIFASDGEQASGRRGA